MHQKLSNLKLKTNNMLFKCKICFSFKQRAYGKDGWLKNWGPGTLSDCSRSHSCEEHSQDSVQLQNSKLAATKCPCLPSQPTEQNTDQMEGLLSILLPLRNAQKINWAQRWSVLAWWSQLSGVKGNYLFKTQLSIKVTYTRIFILFWGVFLNSTWLAILGNDSVGW